MKVSVVTFRLEEASSILTITIRNEGVPPTTQEGKKKNNNNNQQDTHTQINQETNIDPVNRAWTHSCRNNWVHSHSTRGVKAFLGLPRFEEKSTWGEKK